VHTVFDTSTIAASDRVEAWRCATASSLIPTEINSPEPAAFAARLAAVDLGTAQVASLSYTSLSAQRSPRMIRVSDPEYYLIALVRTGEEHVEQHRTRSVIRPGDLMIYDSSQPFKALITSETPPAESVVLQLPKRMLPLSATRVASVSAIPLPGTRGVGRLFAQFLTTVAESHAEYTERDALRLNHTAIDLATAMLAHRLDQDAPPLHSSSHILYLRIIAFIEEHLHRPDLRPATIATAHRISLRYLHRIFQQHHGATLNSHIRIRRITRASGELIDPRLGHLTIASIAARWGFSRPADFSRAFQRQMGISPRDYRTRRQ
jgi:AraC-like DNA-binding protein